MRIHFAIGAAIVMLLSVFIRPALIYNCHSWAWHDGWGDRTDPGNYWFKPWWDDCPCDDMLEAVQVAEPEPGDIVVYGVDTDHDGRLAHGEIRHSGKYLGQDLVESKVGFGPIIHHRLDDRFPVYGDRVEYWRACDATASRAGRDPARDVHAQEARDGVSVKSLWNGLLLMLNLQP